MNVTPETQQRIKVLHQQQQQALAIIREQMKELLRLLNEEGDFREQHGEPSANGLDFEAIIFQQNWDEEQIELMMCDLLMVLCAEPLMGFLARATVNRAKKRKSQAYQILLDLSFRQAALKKEDDHAHGGG